MCAASAAILETPSALGAPSRQDAYPPTRHLHRAASQGPTRPACSSSAGPGFARGGGPALAGCGWGAKRSRVSVSMPWPPIQRCINRLSPSRKFCSYGGREGVDANTPAPRSVAWGVSRLTSGRLRPYTCACPPRVWGEICQSGVLLLHRQRGTAERFDHAHKIGLYPWRDLISRSSA